LDVPQLRVESFACQKDSLKTGIELLALLRTAFPRCSGLEERFHGPIKVINEFPWHYAQRLLIGNRQTFEEVTKRTVVAPARGNTFLAMTQSSPFNSKAMLYSAPKISV
jgi:hypothetical protein